MSNQNLVQFKDAEIKQELLARGGESVGLTAQRDLDRYYALLQHELSRVNLDRNEAMLLCDALNGTLSEFQLNPQQVLYIEISDAIELNQLDEKWEVDSDALLTKIRGMSITQAAAVIDAIERWWHEPESYQVADPEEKLVRVGLVRSQS